jgi:CubicO group peptidase (beta-lactamase class C family)
MLRQLLISLLAPASLACAQMVTPESVGFSSERLKRFESAIQRHVDSKELPGAVTLLARHGKIFHLKTYGVTDLASNAPTRKDTIFQIFSMTKPITGVAMMMLYEEGKWRPSDPIDQHIPEFKNLKVFRGVNSGGEVDIEPVKTPATMSQLLSHSAGFVYGLSSATKVDELYSAQTLFQTRTLQELIDKLTMLPLLYQPGTDWAYSLSVDIQAYLIEKLSGMPAGEFIHSRILAPLGMADTAYFLPKEKAARLATLYQANENNELKPNSWGGNPTEKPVHYWGGHGLLSTAEDYLKFSQMLLNKGQSGGKRFLAPSTVTLMTSNHLPESLLRGQHMGLSDRLQPGLGFGWNFGVFYDPLKAGSPVGKGTYFWAGAAGTWFWIDPENDLICIGMMHRLDGGNRPNLEALSRVAVYQALVAPEK